ncbi:MAG: hypothetical protein EOP34_02710 [Rickettsiales bacterium]|nr:MAG: hypothetical protein EOP34_02710 [Rickettsiales bacterium]
MEDNPIEESESILEHRYTSCNENNKTENVPYGEIYKGTCWNCYLNLQPNVWNMNRFDIHAIYITDTVHCTTYDDNFVQFVCIYDHSQENIIRHIPYRFYCVTCKNQLGVMISVQGGLRPSFSPRSIICVAENNFSMNMLEWVQRTLHFKKNIIVSETIGPSLKETNAVTEKKIISKTTSYYNDRQLVLRCRKLTEKIEPHKCLIFSGYKKNYIAVDTCNRLEVLDLFHKHDIKFFCTILITKMLHYHTNISCDHEDHCKKKLQDIKKKIDNNDISQNSHHHVHSTLSSSISMKGTRDFWG